MSADLGLRGTPAVSRGPALVEPARSGLLTKIADLVQDNVFVVLVLCAAAALQAALSRAEIASDAWYTLVGGRTVVHSGLPQHDVLTVFAHGRSWVDQQWLGHLVLYGLWDGGGWPLAALSIVAMFSGALALCAVSARSLGASERSTSLVLLVCFLVGLPNTALRAQVIAYPLFALVVLLLLADERRPSRRVLLVFPLLVLWANVHGSVVVGAALVALHGATLGLGALRRRGRTAGRLGRAAVLVIAPWACVLASPYALELPGYYHRTLANPKFGQIVFEWTPSTIRNEPIFYAALLLAAWLALGHGRALSAFSRLALALTAIGGLLAIRNIVWFALVGAAVLPRALDAAWTPRRTPRHRRLNLALAGMAVAGLSITAAATASHGRAWFEQGFPGRAAETVAAATAADPGAKVFANDRYADWLLFEQPALRGKIAYDIRFELLTTRELQGIYDFTLQRGPNWRRIARPYSLVVLDPKQQKAVLGFYVRRLHARTLYRDHDVAVVKLPSGGAP